MRIGCCAFSSGFRWWRADGAVCALCEQPGGPGHTLLQCSALSAEREQLVQRVTSERAAQAQETELRRGKGSSDRLQQIYQQAINNNLHTASINPSHHDNNANCSPAQSKAVKKFVLKILSQHPAAALEFIKKIPGGSSSPDDAALPTVRAGKFSRPTVHALVSRSG